MSAQQRDECPTAGCTGDARYAAPGRGHAPHCLYPFPVSQHDDDERTAYERAVLGRILAEARPAHEIPDWIAAITGAMIDARPLLRSAQAPDDAIERAARVLALVDDYDGCFERIDEWERTPVEDRWEIEEPGADDYESADDWRKKARALAAAGLLAPPAPETDAVAKKWDLSPDEVATLLPAAVHAVAWQLLELTMDTCDREPSQDMFEQAQADAQTFLDARSLEPRHSEAEIKAALTSMLTTQRDWSAETFGPGDRLAGVLDHIGKELDEIRESPKDAMEWIDVVILAFDGAWRAGHEPAEIAEALLAKYAKNRTRTWPDWRTMPADKAIEHVRASDTSLEPFGAMCPNCLTPWKCNGPHLTDSEGNTHV